MRTSFVRLAAVAVGIFVVMSCDGGPASPRFGNGISGGPTGTAPVTPPNPGTPDTNRPFVRLDTPTVGQLVNVGDSILTVTRVIDDRQVTSLTLTGFDYAGDPNLGTFVRTVRYGPIVVPQGLAFRTGLTDTTLRRYLQPAVPLDTTVDSLIVMAIGQDGAGNVDTVIRRVNIVTGPKLSILNPIGGDLVPRGLAMAITVRATHPDGVSSVMVRAVGDANWPTPLNDSITTLFPIGALDTTITVSVTIPVDAILGGRITITASGVDVNRNPGSTAPLVVFVRDIGTLAPRVFQNVPSKLEATDSIVITAQGDGIAEMGIILSDSTGAVIPGGDTIPFTAPFTSNQVQKLGLQLGLANQGQRISVRSYAIDAQGRTGFSIQVGTTTPITNALGAFTDTTLVTFGRTFAFPRAGIAGDMAVDPVRGNVLVSNTNFNILEVWNNTSKTFTPNGVPVGSQPWGMFVSNPDTMLVANSGSTTISRVCLGNCVGGTPHEDLAKLIRTRNTIIYQIELITDALTQKTRLTRLVDISYSDRPQYVAQSAGGRVYFSTKPTTSAPAGTLRWLDPAELFPDTRQVFDYATFNPSDVVQYAIFNADSIFVSRTPQASLVSDTLFIFDHVAGQLGPTIVAFDSFPQSAVNKINALGGDVRLVSNIDVTSLALTDTTFVAASVDRNWIGFGEGATKGGTGRLMMVNDPVGLAPIFFSPSITVRDLVDNASEQVFGIAIDSSGLHVAAHGLQTYVASMDAPFHMRLAGVYDSFDNGAGVAFHPRANGTLTAQENRVLFTATKSGVVEILDIAHFNNRGRLVTKGNFYGPLRASGPIPGDPPEVILKIYGLTDAGLVVIDLRLADIKPGP